MDDKSPTSPAPPRPFLSGKRVLLAEDSRSQQRFVASLLEKAGVTVVAAANGQEALDFARQQPFDAILLDMQMPEVDGYEAARRLRLQGYRGPVVALTAGAGGDDERRCLDAGCDGYLAKPVDHALLLGLLMRQLAAPPFPVPLPPVPSYGDLLRDYVSGLGERVQAMAATLAADDQDALAKLAHKLRGSAAMYGFPYLSETAGLLEDAARKRQDRELLRELFDEMAATVRRILSR
jgi:CheY-like chemotaxis protein